MIDFHFGFSVDLLEFAAGLTSKCLSRQYTFATYPILKCHFISAQKLRPSAHYLKQSVYFANAAHPLFPIILNN